MTPHNPPYRFECDACGHVLTLWPRSTSRGPRPCIQPGCPGVLWYRENTERGANPALAQPTDAPREPRRLVWSCWGPERPRDPHQTIASSAKQLRTIATELRQDGPPPAPAKLATLGAYLDRLARALDEALDTLRAATATQPPDESQPPA